MIYPPALWYSYLDGSFLNGALSHRSALLVALQPVSEFETRCYSAVFIQQRRGAQLGHFVAGKVIGRLWTHGLVQDMAIWQRKIIRPDPILSTWDGPIIRYRDWWEKAEHSARGISDSVDEDSNSPVG